MKIMKFKSNIQIYVYNYCTNLINIILNINQQKSSSDSILEIIIFFNQKIFINDILRVVELRKIR